MLAKRTHLGRISGKKSEGEGKETRRKKMGREAHIPAQCPYGPLSGPGDKMWLKQGLGQAGH